MLGDLRAVVHVRRHALPLFHVEVLRWEPRLDPTEDLVVAGRGEFLESRVSWPILRVQVVRVSLLVAGLVDLHRWARADIALLEIAVQQTSS
jgi:hypothetical protein